MRLLFSPRLMFLALLLLTVGCLVRVSSEILAYQGFVHSVWSWLPLSAVTEMAAVTVFAVNLLATFGGRPSSTQLTYRETTSQLTFQGGPLTLFSGHGKRILSVEFFWVA